MPQLLTTQLDCLSDQVEVLWRALGKILQPQASTQGDGISLEA